MNVKNIKKENLLVEDASYEKIIKEMLDIIKEKSNDKDSSVKDSIIQALSNFENKNEN
jgi:hypothetical protein